VPKLRPSLLDALLACAVAAIVLTWLAPQRTAAIFVLSCAGMVPLAAWIGRATEELAEQVGEGLGALLTATFGNAAELIVGIAALRHGLLPLVKASITGAILGNVLLVLGAAILAGGMRFKVQRFNQTGARAQATMLTLAAIALIAPAFFHRAAGSDSTGREASLALAIAVVLLLTYACGLLFSLRTHRRLFLGSGWSKAAADRAEGARSRSTAFWLGVLAVATAFVALLSEILVRAVEPAAHSLGLNQVFIGVVVLAITSNAAEHLAAVQVARHDRMDLALGIALGSSVQIALFVAPLFVLLSHWLAPRPMDFAFSLQEVAAVGAAVLIAGQVAADGETNWLEGVQLLAVYAILAAVFFFLPGGA
jgi:Ca2+:H+ antiporter